METAQKAKQARNASYCLATLNDEKKSRVLRRVAELLRERQSHILVENQKDMERAEGEGVSPVLLKRLALNATKLGTMIDSLNEVATLPDPLGAVIVRRELDTDLLLERVTVPLGVIGIIFESRPDALVQISSLCIKSGNAAILKGGSEARDTNRALYALFVEAMAQEDERFQNCLQLVESREDIRELLAQDAYVDLMIPRGSNDLVRYIQENTRIPVLGHADGVCHVYVDSGANSEMAVRVAVDAKCQYPAVCNAMETLLIHVDVAGQILPELATALQTQGVEMRGDQRTRDIIDVKEATETDWKTEYTDLILSIRVVDSLDMAVAHINLYGSHHTDAIITEDRTTAESFMQRVDSSSVLWNCSTRFADGFRYGLGAEVGISTNRIHARGPVGLEGLLSYKYRLRGSGHVVADYAEGRKMFSHRELTTKGIA